MRPDSAFSVACGLERLSWAEKKALLKLLATSTSPVQDTAAVMGVHPDQVEAIYVETREDARAAYREAVLAEQRREQHATVVRLTA